MSGQASLRMTSRTARASTSPLWLSRIVALLGVVSLWSALVRPMHDRVRILTEIFPAPTHELATAGLAAVALVLIALARGLRRGKRRAWWVGTVGAAVAVVLHLVKGLDVAEAGLAGLILVLLLLGRDNFTAAADPRSGRTIALTTALTIAVCTALGWVLLTLAHWAEAPGTTALDRLQQAFLGLAGISGPMQLRTDAADTAAWSALLMIGGIGALWILTVALRPAGGPHPMTQEEVERLRALVRRHGGADSLSWFALRTDRCVIFSESGKAAISYRVVGGVSLAGGNPIGDPEAWPGAIGAWLRQSHHYGWVPAALGPDAIGARALQRAGLGVREIGDEAVLHTGSFTLQGRAMRGVRQAVGRVRRAGYVVECERLRDLAPARVDAVHAAAERWREGQHERGFSMTLGRLGDPADEGSVVVTATAADGRLVGVLHFVPWGADGLSLDLMRRDPEAENGTVEAMVTALVEQAPYLGVRRVSLNFAAFRGVFERGERLGAGVVQRVHRDALLQASRFWQIEALYRANAKYRPDWVPRYLCYGSSRDLPAVGLAVLRAEALLVAPAWWRRIRGA